MSESGSAAAPEQTSRLRELPVYWWLAPIFLLFGFIRLRLIDFPLERDEGEYAYSGQLLLKGMFSYHSLHTMKLPGMAVVNALAMLLFGPSARGIHLGLMAANFATTLLLFQLAKRLFNPSIAVMAAATFAMLSLALTVNGFAAHATQFLLLPMTAGLLFLLKSFDQGRRSLLFAGGFCLGFAFLIKQPGIFFVMFAWLVLVRQSLAAQRGLRALASSSTILLGGAATPFLLTCLALAAGGDFRSFWFWTVEYAGAYRSGVSAKVALQSFGSGLWNVALANPLLWLAALGGIFTLAFGHGSKEKRDFLFAFLVVSFLAICPALYFRPHYFVLVLPVIAILAAVGASAHPMEKLAGRHAPAVVFCLCFSVSLLQQHVYFFVAAPTALSRWVYPQSPFVEAPLIADFLRSRSEPQDRIAVLGSEPELLFYANRSSATGFIYMYPLTEVQPFAARMQEEMVAEITAAKPRFIVLVNTNGPSWGFVPGSSHAVIDWATRYVNEQYKEIAMVDIGPDRTRYHWDNAEAFQPEFPAAVFVYERIR